MGLLDKVKSRAGHAAARAKEGVHEVQIKHELGRAHEELGKLTFELVESGQVTHAGLVPLVEKVRDLHARLEEHAPVETVEEVEEPPVAAGPPPTVPN